jgi:hypothetical protein
MEWKGRPKEKEAEIFIVILLSNTIFLPFVSVIKGKHLKSIQAGDLLCFILLCLSLSLRFSCFV